MPPHYTNFSPAHLSAWDVIHPVFGHHLLREDLAQALGLERPSTFLFQMESKGMMPVILPYDLLIVQRGLHLQQGQIILSSVNGQFCCRRLRSFPRPIVLEAFNGPQINLPSPERWQVFGRVTGLLRLWQDHPLCWP